MVVAVDLPRLSGVGVGWRPEIGGWVAGLPGLGFCEVIAETVAPAGPSRGVADLRERGTAVIPHGVRLSLGSAEGVEGERAVHLGACAARLDAPLVSEHVAFVRAQGREAGHLLPVPRSREALDVLTANVLRTKAELDVPLALEPIAALFDWPDDAYSEADFLTELLERTDTLLLLDVANVYANAINRGRRPEDVLDRFPLDRIAYVHVAGGAEHDGLYHDTHTDPLPAPVLDLLKHVVERLPEAPPVMLERDGRYPPAAQLEAELDAIAVVVSSPRRTPNTPSHAFQHGESRVPTQRVAASGTLAARQSDLVAALTTASEPPDGFPRERVAVTRRALLRKRAGEAAKAWPLLAASLGAGWPRVFALHRDGHVPVGALRDGWHVAWALRERDELAPSAAVELAERELAWHYDGAGEPRPRGRLSRLGRLLRRRTRHTRSHLG